MKDAEARALTRSDFATMFQASWGRLWCVAVAVVHDRAIAEDVLQEAALVALGKLDQFDAQTSFAAWMGQIVRFVALNHARSHQRRRHAPGEALDSVHAAPEVKPSPVGASGLVRPDQAAFDDRLLAALGELDPTACACLLLRAVEGLSYREIAGTLAIPEGTAMSHVHRSRRALREALADAGTHPSAERRA